MSERGWRRAFEERIEVDGRKLVKLLDADEFLALAFLKMMPPRLSTKPSDLTLDS